MEKVKKAALELVGEEAVDQIREEIRRSSWNSSPRALLESFEYRVEGSQMIIESDHPAARYIDKGVDSYQMTHLTESSKPIPIITDQGELIFRWATEQTMEDGKWQHPGISGKNFIDRGIRKARQRVKEEVQRQVRDELLEEYKRRAKRHARRRAGQELWDE
jgi:hypothetical protein